MSTSISSYLAIQINSLRIQLDKNRYSSMKVIYYRFSRTQLKNSKNNFNFSTSFQNVSFHLNACGIGWKYSETDLSRETSNNEIPLLKPSPSFFSDSCKRRSPILSETQTNLNISRGESSNLLQIKSNLISTRKTCLLVYKLTI